MKLVKIALAAMAAAAAWSPAQAARHLTIEGASGIFRDTYVGCTGQPSCLFTSIFTFDAPTGFQLVGADITSNAASTLVTDPSNIDLDSVTLNGVEFELDESGQFEYGYLISTNLLERDNRLVVTGTTYGQGAFAGTLSFAQAPVPEPATWAMMIVGFGAVGAALRRGRRRSPEAAAV